MKHIIWLVMVLAMLCSAAMAETFEGVGKGFSGEIKVAATIEGGKLTAVEVLSHGETAGISDPAFAKIPAAIIENQTVAVDTVAGCTFSSNGLIEAVTAAWVASGANLDDISKEVAAAEETAKEMEVKTADVVIIGAGGAGMTAAVEVLRAGGSVIVIDKMAAVGGNTIAAGSALNAAGTDIQKAGIMAASSIDAIEEKLALEPKNETMARWQESVRKDLDAYKASGSNHVFDSLDLHKLQTYVDGDYVGKTELIEILCNGAPQAIKYLEELGTVWDPAITAAVGATWQRSHQPTRSFGGAGSDFILPQYEFVKANGGEIVLEHKVEELIMEDGRVVGAKGLTSDGTPFEFRANKSVILATGGFGANVEMRQRFNKFWANLDETVPTTNQPCATGDGIALAEGVGANLIGMEWIQMVTAAPSATFTASIANNIYVNANGERFVAEDSRRDVLSGAVLEQPGSFFWLLSDAKTVWDLMGGKDYTGRTLEQMKERGVVEAETIEELAALMGCDPVKLQASIDQHNAALRSFQALCDDLFHARKCLCA